MDYLKYVMTYNECIRAMAALSVVADSYKSGIDLDNQIGIVDMMLSQIKQARDNDFGRNQEVNK